MSIDGKIAFRPGKRTEASKLPLMTSTRYKVESRLLVDFVDFGVAAAENPTIVVRPWVYVRYSTTEQPYQRPLSLGRYGLRQPVLPEDQRLLT